MAGRGGRIRRTVAVVGHPGGAVVDRGAGGGGLRPGTRGERAAQRADRGSAAAIAAIVYQFIPLYTPPLSARGLAVLFVAAAAAAVAIWRGVYAVLFVQPAFETRVLVFGAGAAGTAPGQGDETAGRHELDQPVPRDRVSHHRVRGRRTGQDAQGAGARRAGPRRSGDLPRLARELKPDQVVLAIAHGTPSGRRPSTR